MKIDYISDLHLDFWNREYNPENPKMKRQLNAFVESLEFNPDSEVLIIAGDLGHYNQQDKEFLLICKENYKHVFIVHGNHDMYLIGNAQMKFKLDSMNRIKDMQTFCKNNGIHYLDGNVVEIEGKRFAGLGMSWDKSYYCKLSGRVASQGEILEFYKNIMNDSRLIFGGGDNYTVNTAYGGKYFHSSFDPFAFFNEQQIKLNNIMDYDNVDVMITHYVPTNPFIYGYDYYKNELSSTFYMFNGEKDIERIQPKKWIFGHMHNNYNFVHKDVNFLCNPLGYPGENTNCKIKTFEIK